jgi:hypothetical protein
MKVFMVYRMRIHHDMDVMGNVTRFPDNWFDDFVFLQEKDALKRVEHLTEAHKSFCERYKEREHYEFSHIQLELKGSWIDV